MLDAMFGRRFTPEELVFAKAAEPPEYMRRIYHVIMIGSVCALVVILLWSWGWLSFLNSRIDWRLTSWVVVPNVVVRLVWEEWIIKHYKRRAKAHSSQPV